MHATPSHRRERRRLVLTTLGLYERVFASVPVRMLRTPKKNERETRAHAFTSIHANAAALPKLDIFGWFSHRGLCILDILPYIFNGLAPSPGS